MSALTVWRLCSLMLKCSRWWSRAIHPRTAMESILTGVRDDLRVRQIPGQPSRTVELDNRPIAQRIMSATVLEAHEHVRIG